MNAQQLKDSILQMAMKGYLVPQNEHDIPFGDSLKKMNLSQNSVKKKRGRPLDISSINDEDTPFQIPDSWKWCRIADISSSYIGLTYKPTDVSEKGAIVLRSSNIKDGKLVLNDTVRVSCTIPDKLFVQDGDILICARNGSKRLVGKSAIIEGLTEPMSFGAFMAICKTPFTKYVYFFLQSDLFFSQLREVSGTTTINQLTQNSFNSFIIPMPPLAEQERIVAKLEKILPIVERYGKGQEKLNTLNDELPDKLRKSVLQEAIKGNLVPNDIPNGETTAPELLQQILKERQEIEYNEKGKKAKRLTLSIVEEEPWELPEGWCWCGFDDLCKTIGNKENQIKATEIKEKGIYPVVSQGQALIDGYFDDKEKVISNIPVIIFGDHTKNVKYIDFPFIIGADGTKVLSPFHGLYAKWFYYAVLYFASIVIYDRGYARHVSLLSKELFPLPPLVIQHRIVEKIEEVFSEINKLQA